MTLVMAPLNMRQNMIKNMGIAMVTVMATGMVITKTRDPSAKRAGGSDCCHNPLEINIE